MKKTVLLAALAAFMVAIATAAMPFSARRSSYHHSPPFRPSPVRQAPPPKVHPPRMKPPYPHQHCHSSTFWTGLGIGILGGLAIDAFRPVPPVTPPVVIRNPVWVQPVYESRPVIDAYGRVIRYEQVIVREGYWR